MATFTTFSESALERYLVMFNMGELAACEPIQAGIENSNYYVTLKRGDLVLEFVLTITENLSFDEVGFFNDLLTLLAKAGLPVPMPERTLDGMYSTIFCGKPTWLFPRLPGHHPEVATEAQCKAIGVALAKMHEAGARARYHRANPYDAQWLGETFSNLRNRLGKEDQALFERILCEYEELADSDDLPKGIIHGDLFRDNVLFTDDRLTGIIDFYHACDDFLVQDLAICINDWCTTSTGELDSSRFDAMVEGYESIRPLTSTEQSALPKFRRAAAMRFVLTRFLSGDESGHLKDPDEFLRIARGASSE